MTSRSLAILLSLLSLSALAQTTTVTTLNVRADIAVSTGGTKTSSVASGGGKSHCSSSPFTADSPIFSLALVLEPQIAGLTRWRINGALSDQSTPQNVYFVIATPVQVTSLRTSRRE